MRISQYVYFCFRSESMSAAEITARLGIEPDEFGVRGSKSRDPVRPVCHSWKVQCDRSGMCIHEQVEDVIGRLAPYLDRIVGLAAELEATNTGSTTLHMVREFDTDQGEEENDPVSYHDGQEMIRLPGQHQLLGWHLDHDVLNFLVKTGASLDVDEYG